MGFFELRTPADMLKKAERELARFQSDFSIDSLFNFFVTAYHVQDYIRATAAVPQAALESLLADPDLRACRDLCDKGKHLRLTRRSDPDTDMVDGCFSGATFGELAFSEGEEWTLVYDDRAVEVRSLAERVINKWKSFFARHGI